MITIKMNPYTEAEKRAMSYTMECAFRAFLFKYCKDNKCRDCDYCHLCYDLQAARGYTFEKAGGKSR